MKERYSELISNIFIFAFGTVGSKLVSFFLLPLYTNVLTSSEYGVADLVFTTSEVIRPIISLAIYNGLLRFGISKEYKRENVLRCATIVLIVGSILTIIITPIFEVYHTLSEWKWYLCVYVIVVFASKNAFIYLKILNKNREYAFLSIVQAFLLSILLLIYWKKGVKGYLYANILAPALVTGIALYKGSFFQDLKRSVYDRITAVSMVQYSLPFILNDLSWWIIHSSDKYMIERMMETDSLGLYTAASKIPLMLTVLMGIFSQAWDLSAVKEYETSNETSFFSRTFKYFIVLLSGLTIVFISIIKPFMKIYVGEAFVEAWKYVPLLLMSAVFSCIASFAGSLCVALKKSSITMWSTITAGILNLLVNYILIRKIGIWGAVIGTVFAYFVVAIVRLYKVNKYIRFLKGNISILIIFLSMCVQAIFVGLDIYGGIISFICIVIYGLFCGKEIRNLISILLKVIMNRFNNN